MAKKADIELMIKKLFETCDQYVWVEDCVQFEDQFSKVTKKFGFDLHQIYYGKSYKEMKATYIRYNVLHKDPKISKPARRKMNKIFKKLREPIKMKK